MSGGIPDIAGLGYLPLRHEDERVDIGLRHIVNAVGVKKIDALDPNLVTEIPHSAGDVVCASFWLVDRAKRNCPGWAFAWPAKVTTPGKDGGSQIRGDDGQRVRPILDATIKADERFEEKQTGAPSWASKPPKGWTGIVVAGTQENKQEMTFHPDALGLVASNGAGDPDLSTLVMDLDAEGRPDDKRLAHLNSAWQVVREPKTVPSIGGENGIAWQHGSGKGGRSGYGLITGAGVAPQAGGSRPAGGEGDGRIETSGGTTDSQGRTYNPDGSISNPGMTIGSVSGVVESDTSQSSLAASGSGHACMSVFAGGPIAIPAAGDQHQLGADADGNPIFAAHLHTSAIWLGPDAGQDGPFAFERGGFPKLQPGNFLTPVHLRFDPATAHVWSAAQRPGVGQWRMFAETLLYVPDPPTTTPPTTPPETTPPPTAPPPTTPKRKKRRVPPPPPTTPGDGGTGQLPPTTPRDPQPPEPPRGGGVDAPTETTVTPGGGGITPPGGEGDRPENPPPRPPGTPTGSVDRGTGLPAPPPKDGPVGAFPEGDTARGDETTPFPRRPDSPIDPSLPKGGWIDPAEDLDEDSTEYDPDKDPGRSFGRRPQGANRRYVALVNELAVPGLLIRPGSFGCGKPDLRNTINPSEAEVREHDRAAPVIARLEGAWVKSGSSCGSAEPSYTYKSGVARYVGGTARGILTWFPPETSYDDQATDYAPGGVTLSTLTIATLKGSTQYGSGVPDPTTGLLKSGWKWGARSADDKFALVSTTAAGVDDKTAVVPNLTGTIPVASSITANAVPKWVGTTGEQAPTAITDDGATISIARNATVTGGSTLSFGTAGDGVLQLPDFVDDIVRQIGVHSDDLKWVDEAQSQHKVASKDRNETITGKWTFPSNTTDNALKFGTTGGLNSYSTGNTSYTENLYYDGAWKYVGNGGGTLLYQSNGTMTVYTAPVNAGGAGAAATIVDRFSIGPTGVMKFANVQGTSGTFAKFDSNGMPVTVGDAAAARTLAGLGTIATQDASVVGITGGEISGAIITEMELGRTAQTASSAGNYNVASTVVQVFVDASALTAAQNYDVTLPSAATFARRQIRVKVTVVGAAASTVTVKSSSGTVEGAAAGTGVPMDASARSKITYMSDGTNWWSV